MKGFRWLTEFDGHWNYVITTKTKPTKLVSKKVTHLNKSYHLFHKGSAKVIYVVGEFYWQVKRGETVQVEDYVSPPEILSSEKSDNEIVWSLGEYVSSSEVKSSFQITKSMPLQIGVGPNQPSTVKNNSIGMYWVIFLSIIFFIQLSAIDSTNKTVYSGQFIYSCSDNVKLRVTPQFKLDEKMANLEVTVSSAVQNNWLEVQSDLINDGNGESEDFEQGIEYYSGFDSDGSWSEGSPNSSVILSSIPSGTYHLNIETSGPALPTVCPELKNMDVKTPENALPRFSYWQNGKLKSAEPILNGMIEGVAKYFFENGLLNKEIAFRNGIKNGPYTVYAEDSTIQQKGFNLNGLLSGSVKWYDSNGAITRNVYYSNGIQIPINSADTSSVTLNVTVKRDVTTWSNFLWALFLISFFPIIVLWRNRNFEMNRWSNSDFSPYYLDNSDNKNNEVIQVALDVINILGDE
jgi:antitoxin component YwqK of YwqJK toxin-antitoxin module